MRYERNWLISFFLGAVLDNAVEEVNPHSTNATERQRENNQYAIVNGMQGREGEGKVKREREGQGGGGGQ